MITKVAVFLPFCIAVAFASDCQSPKVKSSIYFTQEAALSIEAVVSTTFGVTCNSKAYTHPVYVEWNGKIIPAAKDTDGNFQASFTCDHTKFSTGKHTLRVFDEEGFSAFRKAGRTGESSDNIKTLGKIEFENKGVWKGPFARSDLTAVGIFAVALYIAYSQKSKF